MKKFVIERELPGLGNLTPEELKKISVKSCDVVNHMDEPYHWLESFVTDNKMFCVHIAPDESTVRKHAEQGGFPITKISEVKSIIDPTTAH